MATGLRVVDRLTYLYLIRYIESYQHRSQWVITSDYAQHRANGRTRPLAPLP